MNNIEKEFDESGFPRVANIMRGNVPSVKTLTFITGENPKGIQATPEYNKDANARLQSILGTGQWGYEKIRGKYGNVENTFLVRNMKKDDALMYGKSFNQDSVIFGNYFQEGGHYGMLFQMISTQPETFGDVMGERKVFINRGDESDFYSEVKGRRFQIPFFDVEKKVKGDKDKGIPDRMVTRDYDNAKWKKEAGKILGSKKIKDVEIPDEDKEKVENLQESALNTTGSTAYSYRGRINNILKKYF
jgi:hypothetical protein